MKRRNFIATAAAGSVGMVSNTAGAQQSIKKGEFKLKNNINHSVCKWCFNHLPLEDFLKVLNNLGIKAIDLICFSGNRRGMNDYVGLQNCVDGLSQILPLAEKHGIIIQMELFNQQNHPDYMCDSSIWGVELCRRLGSDNFKLLYDIYHMQIQEGDIINTIKTYHEYFGHYHTAGVPGRNEIDETQELYYPAIMKAILETGYKGHVAQEFIPTWDDKIAALKDAFMRCDV